MVYAEYLYGLCTAISTAYGVMIYFRGILSNKFQRHAAVNTLKSRMPGAYHLELPARAISAIINWSITMKRIDIILPA